MNIDIDIDYGRKRLHRVEEWDEIDVYGDDQLGRNLAELRRAREALRLLDKVYAEARGSLAVEVMNLEEKVGEGRNG